MTHTTVYRCTHNVRFEIEHEGVTHIITVPVHYLAPTTKSNATLTAATIELVCKRLSQPVSERALKRWAGYGCEGDMQAEGCFPEPVIRAWREAYLRLRTALPHAVATTQGSVTHPNMSHEEKLIVAERIGNGTRI